MEIQTALQTLEADCRKTIEEAGHDWLISKIGEVSNLDPEKVRAAAEKALASDELQESIEHHSEKVMEHGYNEGRIEARCGFMINDWLHFIDGFWDVVKAAVEAEGGTFTDETEQEDDEEAPKDHRRLAKWQGGETKKKATNEVPSVNFRFDFEVADEDNVAHR